MQTLADKVMKFCSYQERSRLEVRRKMASLKMPPAEAERLLADLVEMNFVSDERFVESFTDDASVVEALGEKVTGVEGNRENIKITTPFDMLVAKTLMECWISQQEQ